MKPYNLFLLILVFTFQVAAAQQNQLQTLRGQVITNPERYGNGIFVHIVNGDNQMVRGYFENAIIAYDNAIAQDPYFAGAYIKRAMAKYKLGRTTEAAQDIHFVSKLNPYAADLYGYKNNARKLNVLAFDLYQTGYVPTLWDRLHYYENDSNLPEINTIISQIGQEQFSLAQERLDELMRTKPNYSTVYDLKGLIYYQLGDIEQAKAMHQTAIEIDANNDLAYYNLSLVQRSAMQLQEALYNVNQAIELNDRLAKAYFQRASLLKMLGNTAAAIADYDHVATLDGFYQEEALLNRAISKKMTGDVLGSLEDLDEAAATNMNNPRVLFTRGNTHVLLEQYYAAVDDYTKAIQLDIEFAEAYHNRGIANLMLYNYPDGCHDLQEAVRLGYDKGETKLQYFCGF